MQILYRYLNRLIDFFWDIDKTKKEITQKFTSQPIPEIEHMKRRHDIYHSEKNQSCHPL